MASADPVFTLADLDRWSFSGTALAVLGFPIGHSISPAMHNAALAEMAAAAAQFANWKYFRFEVRPEDLPNALGQFHAKGFRGLNLTVPHKMIAFDQLVDVDPAAKVIRAVNTLLWKTEGWRGFNTDGHGLAGGLREDLRLELPGQAVILLGAGGAARSAAVECIQQGTTSLWIGNRTRERLDALLADLRPLTSGTEIHGFDSQSPPHDLPSNALVLNATSSGLRESDAPTFDLEKAKAPKGVYDMIYNPPRTPFLRQAAKLGLPFANGLSMLVHQGARALEIWSESPVPVAAMRRGAEEVLKK